MATPWLKRIRLTGELLVFNKAGAWSADVDKAIKTFNSLGLGCKMTPTKDENSAHVVIILAKGKKNQVYSINHYGDVATSNQNFQSDQLDGQTATLKDDKRKELFFAGIFLPGNYPKPTADQKEMIVVHELIHAAGMNEHDSYGIMFSHMIADGKGILEYLHDEGAKSMPPIRLGGMTKCKVQLAWATDASEAAVNAADACKKD